MKTRFDGHTGAIDLMVGAVVLMNVNEQTVALAVAAPDLLDAGCELAEALVAIREALYIEHKHETPPNGCLWCDVSKMDARIAAWRKLVDPEP